jgi:hypothetical protein
MARRIDSLKAGETVTLLFRGSKSLGNEPYTDEVIFVGIKGEGEDRRAVFSTGPAAGKSGEWEAYRYKGGWAYGSSAERLSIAQ